MEKIAIDWGTAILSMSGVFLLNSLSVNTRLWGWILSFLSTCGYLYLYAHLAMWGLFTASIGWILIEARGIYICLNEIKRLKTLDK